MSDGATWGDADAKATDPRTLAGLTAAATEKRLALEAAVRGSTVLMGVLRVVVTVARALVGTLPFGASVKELVAVGLEIAEREMPG